MRVLVTGGRYYQQRDLVWLALDLLHAEQPISVVIHGGATGADSLAGAWARHVGLLEERYDILPGEGGFQRNTRMLAFSRPDLVVRFPGGNGTRDMVMKATAAGVEVRGGLAVRLVIEGEERPRLI